MAHVYVRCGGRGVDGARGAQTADCVAVSATDSSIGWGAPQWERGRASGALSSRVAREGDVLVDRTMYSIFSRADLNALAVYAEARYPLP